MYFNHPSYSFVLPRRSFSVEAIFFYYPVWSCQYRLLSGDFFAFIVVLFVSLKSWADDRSILLQSPYQKGDKSNKMFQISLSSVRLVFLPFVRDVKREEDKKAGKGNQTFVVVKL